MDGQPAYAMGFTYGPSVGVATETVFRAVNVNGAFYNYYYDALGRRRSKSYPGGTSEEFFHDVANQLLVDRGSSSTTTPVAHYTQDDYVWLDGRPVLMGSPAPQQGPSSAQTTVIIVGGMIIIVFTAPVWALP